MLLAGGICAGILLGPCKLSTGGVVLGLGTAGSILVVGLLPGGRGAGIPCFGAIPNRHSAC
jgi:uncharacterized transporter YbjL